MESHGNRIRPHAAAAAAGHLEFIAAAEFLQAVSYGDPAKQIPLECQGWTPKHGDSVKYRRI